MGLSERINRARGDEAVVRPFDFFDTCNGCGARTAINRVHGRCIACMPVQSPFTRAALAGTLPAKVLR